jgi:RNA polymerase sigma-70 factor (ECF subfamily)
VNQNTTDIELIKLLNQGNTLAFDALYFRYHKVIFANVLKFVKKQEEAEELLQDVFVALWQNKHKINSHQSILGWLTIVSHNKSINYLNKAVKLSLTQNGILPLEIADLPEINDPYFELQLKALEEAINQLPPKKKEVFLLCKLQGKTYEETATILGISVNTVKEHIKTASKFIKAYSTINNPSTSISLVVIAYILQ